MNPDLIEKLSKLNPTEGEWEFNLTYRMLNAVTTIAQDDRTHTSVNPIGQIYLNDDASLIKLAPTMRIEILNMAKEIEDLKERILRMKDTSGREGCTYGDTDYDSLSVVYGYNLAIDNIVSLL